MAHDNNKNNTYTCNSNCSKTMFITFFKKSSYCFKNTILIFDSNTVSLQLFPFSTVRSSLVNIPTMMATSKRDVRNNFSNQYNTQFL